MVLAVLMFACTLALRTPMGGARIRRSAPIASPSTARARGAPGVFGLDVSDPNIPASMWSCMHTQGNYSFAIIEGWRGGYQLQPVADNVAYAWAGGFSHVDVYAFMCSNCNNGPQSAQALVNYLRQNNVQFGMIWLDVEQCSGCWCGSVFFPPFSCVYPLLAGPLISAPTAHS